MFEVAKNSSIQNKLSVEIEDMFERSEGSPEYSDIVRMKYLDACLNGNCIICSLYARHITFFAYFTINRNTTQVPTDFISGTVLHERLQNEKRKLSDREGNARIYFHFGHTSQSEILPKSVGI